MRCTVRHLADGREIFYYDDSLAGVERVAVDTRDLPAVASSSEIRLDPLTNEWVAIAAHRQTRTYKPPADLCPLCPSRPGKPSEVPESDYDVVVFENRFPSFADPTSSAAPLAENQRSTVDGLGLVPIRPGHGRCEVVCFTSDHNQSFSQLDPARVRTVMDVWADRTARMSELDSVRQVYPFENRGEEIGVTLHHPHGQVYGYPFITPKTARMIEVARAYQRDHGRPIMGDVLAAELKSGSRVLIQGEHWTAFVPPAARWPIQVQIVPHRQVPDLPALNEAERNEFADIYLRILRACDALYERPLPYVASWYQAPVDQDRDLVWLHFELFSILRGKESDTVKLKYLAGSESGMAVWINDVTPESIAERLRARM